MEVQQHNCVAPSICSYHLMMLAKKEVTFASLSEQIPTDGMFGYHAIAWALHTFELVN
jgi:hypothetical protein